MKCLYCKRPLDENDMEEDVDEACLRCPACEMRGPLACRKCMPDAADLRAEAIRLHQEAEERLEKDRKDLVEQLAKERERVEELRHELVAGEEEMRRDGEKLAELERVWYPVEAELKGLVTAGVVDVNTDEGYVDVVIELHDALKASESAREKAQREWFPVRAALATLCKHEIKAPNYVDLVGELRDLVTLPAPKGPPLVWDAGGETGEGEHVCAGCGEPRLEMHTWAQCRASIVMNEQLGAAQAVETLSKELSIAQNALRDCDSWTRVGPDGFSTLSVFQHIREVVAKALAGSASPQTESIAHIAREVLVWGRKANSDAGHTWDPEYANELLDRLRDAIELRTTVYCLVGREGLEGVFLSPKGAFARRIEGGSVLHPAEVYAGCLEIASEPMGLGGQNDDTIDPVPRVSTSVLQKALEDILEELQDCEANLQVTDHACRRRGATAYNIAWNALNPGFIRKVAEQPPIESTGPFKGPHGFHVKEWMGEAHEMPAGYYRPYASGCIALQLQLQGRGHPNGPFHIVVSRPHDSHAIPRDVHPSTKFRLASYVLDLVESGDFFRRAPRADRVARIEEVIDEEFGREQPDYRGLLEALLGAWDACRPAFGAVSRRFTDAIEVARVGLLASGPEAPGRGSPDRRPEDQTPDNDTYRARELSDLAMLASALEVDDTTFMTGAHYALIPLDIAKTGLAALQRYLSRTHPDLQFELERLVAVAREELTVSQEWIERADRVLTATQRERSAEFEADLAKLTEAQRRARERGHLSPEASGGLSGTHYEAHDPVARALDEAPLDDEPVTEQERLEIDEARSEAARGLGITTSELKRRMPQKSTFAATDLPAGWRATKTGYWRSDGMRLHFDGTYWRAAKTDYVEPDYQWSDSMKAMVELNGSFPANVDTRWTIGEDNRYNTSRAFQACTSTVLKLMANHRLEEPLEPRAGMIVAQLAGIHGLRPPNAYGELAAQLSGFKNIANEVLGSKREQNVLLVWVAAKFDDLVTALGG